MAFETPITIKVALDHIHRHEYVLPAIQREFVWRTDQIERLFDSLMLGYPIGSFLFWKVDKENSKDFVFYDFMREYHERHSRHLPRLDLGAGENVTAVLDGQQRLTALNIGLRGSHAQRVPRHWVTSPWAYPAKKLYLDLSGPAEANDLGLTYGFRFLTDDDARRDISSGKYWFPVSQILTMTKLKDVFGFLQQQGLADSEFAFPALSDLFEVVHVTPIVSAFEEKSQDIDKVLNIFIRVNSGGTVLSYSDLLLSIATSQWKETDAREAIYGLVDELNETGQGFAVTKDLVLKAGLLLSDVPSVAFRVSNFNVRNMGLIEDNWSRISRALRMSVRLFADFGFSERTLSAHSAVLPVAYYLYAHAYPDNYLTLDRYRPDREAIRSWVTKSLVKPGVWGSALDTLLQNLRSTLRDAEGEGFPVAALEATMAKSGKPLTFDDAEIDNLLDVTYSDRRAFPLLALLYPGFDFRNEFHVDHVYPRALLTPARLKSCGIEGEEAVHLQEMGERLPNLQLLEGTVNIAKNDSSPHDWVLKHYPDETSRNSYLARHNMGVLPQDALGVGEFFDGRRERMQEKLTSILRS